MANNPVHFTNYQVHCPELSAVAEYVSYTGKGTTLHQTQHAHCDKKKPTTWGRYSYLKVFQPTIHHSSSSCSCLVSTFQLLEYPFSQHMVLGKSKLSGPPSMFKDIHKRGPMMSEELKIVSFNSRENGY